MLLFRPQIGVLMDDAPEDFELEAAVELSGSKRARFLWRSPRERASYRAMVEASTTCARIAYCAVALAHACKGTFECLRGEYKKKKYWN